jgi:hypothetical protein
MRTIVVVIAFLALVSGAWAGSIGDAVEVEVRSDSGGSLSLYPVDSRYPNRKAYVEAVKGDHYSIIVRNRLNRRIGIVVAVDGRNIISGKKSWLRNSERMYILEPYGSGEYAGWRTGMDTINRFYFTSVADSYAAAFKDKSAMGVIAVAVYPEMRRYVEEQELSRYKAMDRAAPAPSAKGESESAGTGFGREEYSPSRVVAFEPEASAAEKIFLKYEWRSTLCRKGIIYCGKERPSRNRMWDDDGFAPHPPGRK